MSDSALKALLRAIETVQLCTVKIKSSSGTGTGLLLDERGVVVTCAHVVGNSPSGKVGTPFDGVFDYEVIIKGSPENDDAAILRADFGTMDSKLRKELAKRCGVLGFRRTEPANGEPVVICGYPGIFGSFKSDQWNVDYPLLISGIVSFATGNVIAVNAMINHGNSGGPCLDKAGRIIGLATELTTLGTIEVTRGGEKLSIDLPSNYGMLVPISTILDLAEKADVRLRQTKAGFSP